MDSPEGIRVNRTCEKIQQVWAHMVQKRHYISFNERQMGIMNPETFYWLKEKACQQRKFFTESKWDSNRKSWGYSTDGLCRNGMEHCPTHNFTLQMKGPVRIQYKCLVPIYVFPEIKLLFPKQYYNCGEVYPTPSRLQIFPLLKLKTWRGPRWGQPKPGGARPRIICVCVFHSQSID